jgi:plastocyanin
MRKTILLALLLTPCLAAAAAAQYDDGGPYPEPGDACASGDTVINLVDANFTFSPANVTVPVDTTVCWQWNGSMPHNVRANDGSFSSGDLVIADVYRVTFTAPGTVGYHCQLHGNANSGMRGSVTVEGDGGGGGGGGGGGNDTPGSLQLSAANYNAGESAGSVTITVQRSGGDDGAVTVQYATANGTATAGQDYTASSGTLSWADSNDSPKTFNVSLLGDSADEANETFTVTISNPTGGATLGTRTSATVTINDDDGAPGGGSPPPMPTGLAAAGQSTSEISVTWNDVSGETGYRLERRTLTGTFAEIATLGAGTTSHLDSGLLEATAYVYRLRAEGSGGFSPYTALAQGSTHGSSAPCAPDDTTLCLNNGRFRVELDWRTATQAGSGMAVPLPTAPDSGLFYFFSPSNLEMLLKVLNACSVNNRYWVFYAATTNVELTVTVTDTQTARTKVYFNPLDQAAPPVQDTSAFATCP